MNRIAIATAAVLAVVLAGGSAYAKVYDFTFTGATNYDVTGTFTTDNSNDITAASGTVTSIGAFPAGPFTVAGPGAGGGGGQDWSNTYDPILNEFTGNGLGLDIGGTFASLYNGVSAGYAPCPGTCFSVDGAPGGLYNPGDVGALTISAVPEPAAWAVMLLGFFGLGAVLRRSRPIPMAA